MENKMKLSTKIKRFIFRKRINEEERNDRILKSLHQIEERLDKFYTRLSLLDQYWSHHEIRSLMCRTIEEYVREGEKIKAKQEAFKAQYERDLTENLKVFLPEEMAGHKSFDNKPDTFEKI